MLPAWKSLLAVVAHPDDESFGLGAVLDAFVGAGTDVTVLCLTHGEASSLVPAEIESLARLRATELEAAARALGVQRTILRNHADGSLAQDAAVFEDVLAVATEVRPDGLLVFDVSGVTGHADHAAATAAAVHVAERLDLPVLAWTIPKRVAEALNADLYTSFAGSADGEIDLVVAVDRERQRLASLAHASQAVPTSVLWKRLELLGEKEHLRWLRRPAAPAAPAADAESVLVTYRHGDQFEIAVRDHLIAVDQPEDVGGDDLGPTPTELFVAGLVSCVAFYARRYLRRHKYDATGLTVAAEFTMAAKPARVDAVTMRIDVPAELPSARRDGLLAVASHCTVHNSITTPPEMSIVLN